MENSKFWCSFWINFDGKWVGKCDFWCSFDGNIQVLVQFWWKTGSNLPTPPSVSWKNRLVSWKFSVVSWVPGVVILAQTAWKIVWPCRHGSQTEEIWSTKPKKKWGGKTKSNREKTEGNTCQKKREKTEGYSICVEQRKKTFQNKQTTYIYSKRSIVFVFCLRIIFCWANLLRCTVGVPSHIEENQWNSFIASQRCKSGRRWLSRLTPHPISTTRGRSSFVWTRQTWWGTDCCASFHRCSGGPKIDERMWFGLAVFASFGTIQNFTPRSVWTKTTAKTIVSFEDRWWLHVSCND